jgi:hypothetical protein
MSYGAVSAEARDALLKEVGLYRSHYANVCGEHLGRVKMPETLDFSIIQADLAY